MPMSAQQHARLLIQQGMVNGVMYTRGATGW